MRGYLLFRLFLLVIFSAPSWSEAFEREQLEPKQLEPEQYDGLSFTQSGPNCFGAALKLAGHYPTFRGVDTAEFETFLKLACVITESPQRGDIGVYVVPNYGAVHAFLYIDSKTGMDKHNPKSETIVGIRPIRVIDHYYLTPVECRQYSPDNLALCSNEKVFYRCDGRRVHGLAREYQSLVRDFETEIAKVLNRKDISHSVKKIFEEELSELQIKLQVEVDSGHLSDLEASHLKAQLESLTDQVAYLN